MEGKMFLPVKPNVSSINTADDISVTTNSTQTPSDLSPKVEGDILHKAHHQNSGHCIASFAAINRMRQNSQAISLNTTLTMDELVVPKRYSEVKVSGGSRSDLKLENESKLGSDLKLENESKLGSDLKLENESKLGRDLKLENESKLGSDLKVGNELKLGSDLKLENESKLGRDLK
ncbi:hypothetical protein Bhyg_08951 [Pseudolycoriella hygida]|uniref:Uncharacterized protein n=1 Tax=Pseudolycoriella hygida TaxID=35572 RepID=A0A9Q0N6V9_9DIPT|nr:hypothetical protein Bhyg_08951 [Pseudolycoriella hygida]